MKVFGRTWFCLTEGEQMSALGYAAYRTRMKWLRLNLCNKKEQSTGLGAGRL